MTGYLLPGILGLLLGLTLTWTRLCCPEDWRAALALRRCHTLRSALYALGVPMVLTALLCWLAVIDVDGIEVLPLSAGALTGGALFGVATALGGYTPLTAFAGIGGRRGVEALCTLAGCMAGMLALPLLAEPLKALQAAPPQSATTLFRVTLDEPWLLGGGFLGQGCVGMLLMVIAVCIPTNLRLRGDASVMEKKAGQPEELPAPEVLPDVEESAAGEPPALPEPEPVPLLPAAAPEETFVALLPGEEPLVVDTGLADESSSEDADATPTEESEKEPTDE